jgi:hypothetical protein
MDYMLKRWPAFIRFLDDGRICLTNDAVERAVRCVAPGRRNWTFCAEDKSIMAIFVDQGVQRRKRGRVPDGGVGGR